MGRGLTGCSSVPLLSASWLNLLQIRLLLLPCWRSFLRLGYPNLQFSTVQATSDGTALPCHVPSAADLVPQGFLAGGVCGTGRGRTTCAGGCCEDKAVLCVKSVDEPNPSQKWRLKKKSFVENAPSAVHLSQAA